jgi:hypothetical protein
LTPAQLEAPPIHADLLQPHVEQISAKCPRLMYAAIKSRALATGQSTGFVVRELIRAGAAHMSPPMDVTGCGVPPVQQEGQ